MLRGISHGKLAGKLPTGEPRLVLFGERGERVVYQSRPSEVCDKTLWRMAQENLRKLNGVCVSCERTRQYLSSQTTWCSHPRGRVGIYHCSGCGVIYAKLKLDRTGEKFYWTLEHKRLGPVWTPRIELQGPPQPRWVVAPPQAPTFQAQDVNAWWGLQQPNPQAPTPLPLQATFRNLQEMYAGYIFNPTNTVNTF